MHKNLISPEDKIIHAGVFIFSEFGYQKASMSQIATKAKVSKPLLFHYYRTKKVLFQSCLEFARLQVRQLKLSPAPQSVFDSVRALTKAKLKLQMQYPGLFKLLSKQTPTSPKPPAPFTAADLTLLKPGISPKTLWDLLYYLSLGLNQSFIDSGEAEVFFSTFDEIFNMITNLVTIRRSTHATSI
jgi:TetR/AcrR family transcriptional regulator